MNYNISGIDMMILELFVMFDTAKVDVGFRDPATLERFKLWGACRDLNLPNLPTRQSHGLARRTQGKEDMAVYPGSGHLVV